MGVLGLWRLLEPSGKPTPVETLEGKVLAIDVSIWIHQILQSYKDGRGDSVQNAHLLGLFNRICKLLYFKIKPVFVFDGGVPFLKRNTIATRRKLKSIAGKKAKDLKHELRSNIIKRCAVKDILDQERYLGILDKPFTANDSYTTTEPSTSKSCLKNFDSNDESDYISSEESSPQRQSKWIGNIHNVNIATDEFKSLPADVRYDILTDLKDTRKQNSWGRLHEMPTVLNDFSDFQMKRLLKRRYVQETLEAAEKEIGGCKNLTLEELDKLLTEQGIKTADSDDRLFKFTTVSSCGVIFDKDKNTDYESTDNRITETRTDEKAFISSEQTSRSHAEFEELTLSDSMLEYNKDDNWDSDVDELSPPLLGKYVRNNSTLEKTKKYILDYSSLTKEQIHNFMQEKRRRKLKCLKGQNASSKCHKKDRPKSKSDEVKNFKFENINAKINQQELNVDEGQFLADITHFYKDETQENKDINTDYDPIENLDCLSVKDSILLNKKQNIVDHRLNVLNFQDISSESSDSNYEFIAVGNSILEASHSPEIEVRDGFDIIVKPGNNIENDLFADIFGGSDLTKFKNVLSEIMEGKTVNAMLTQNEINLNCKNCKLESLDDRNIDEKQNESIFIGKKDELINDCKRKSPAAFDDAVTSEESIEAPNITSIITSESSCRTLNYIPLTLTKTDFDTMKDKLEDEQEKLNEEIGKLERQTMNITDQMYTEAQELLQLFGVPYIVAPMEAEAQCAYLEQINLTDGTITDDSDIWLFGSKCVYKNFFNNNRNVLQFRSSDIQHHFKLSRRELIQFALLVGSDYSSGLRGIGPVTAMEILAAFPSEEESVLQGLINFSEWVKSGKTSGSDRVSLRNKLKNLQIEEGFPSQAVVQAYLYPTVDESKEKFAWKKPNLNLLLDYVTRKFSWNKVKFEKVINPIMKKFSENILQKGIDAYLKFSISPRNVKGNLSKRIQSAINRMEFATMEEGIDSSKKKNTETDSNNLKVIDETGSLLLSNELLDHEKLSGKYVTKEANSSQLKESLAISQKILLKGKNMNKKIVNEEYIPQRDHTREKAIRNKIHAIEVFRNSRKNSSRLKKKVKHSAKIFNKAELSESSSSS